MGGVPTRWNSLSRREVLGFVTFFVVLGVFGAVWVAQAFLDIDDNKESVCASLTNLAADRRSRAVTSEDASSGAQDIFERAELGRDRQLAAAAGDYGQALSSGDRVRVQRAEAALEQMCDESPDR